MQIIKQGFLLDCINIFRLPFIFPHLQSGWHFWWIETYLWKKWTRMILILIGGIVVAEYGSSQQTAFF